MSQFKDNLEMKSSIDLSIKYDGGALMHHQMDVRYLSPALLALNDLINQSKKELFPGDQDIQVVVRGSFKSGSFGVELIAIQPIAEQIFSIFSGREAATAANLITIIGAIGFTGKGLISLLKWLKGRRPSEIKKIGNKAVFEVIENGAVTSIEVDLEVEKLYSSRVVKQSIVSLMRPLSIDGIDDFYSSINGQKMIKVAEKSNFEHFFLSATEADVVSDILNEKMLLQIASASFKDGNKWKFSEGGMTFFAEIVDEEFLVRVNTGEERFGKNDVLVVNLRKIQYVTDNGLKMEYLIEKVFEHRDALQNKLFP